MSVNKGTAELVIQTALTLLTAVCIYLMIDISQRLSELSTGLAVLVSESRTLAVEQDKQEQKVLQLQNHFSDIKERVLGIEAKVDNTGRR